MKHSIIDFLTAVTVSAFIAWLGGYDFDTRGFGVALWAAATLVAAAMWVSLRRIDRNE